MWLAICEQKRRDDVILNRFTEYFTCTRNYEMMYPDSGYIQTGTCAVGVYQALPLCWEGLGDEARIHSLSTELLVDTFARMAS